MQKQFHSWYYAESTTAMENIISPFIFDEEIDVIYSRKASQISPRSKEPDDHNGTCWQ